MYVYICWCWLFFSRQIDCVCFLYSRSVTSSTEHQNKCLPVFEMKRFAAVAVALDAVILLFRGIMEINETSF